jgi:hypothetical protein
MEEVVCTSIIEHFSALPDPRIALKTSHQRVDIVTMGLCAIALLFRRPRLQRLRFKKYDRAKR